MIHVDFCISPSLPLPGWIPEGPRLEMEGSLQEAPEAPTPGPFHPYSCTLHVDTPQTVCCFPTLEASSGSQAFPQAVLPTSIWGRPELPQPEDGRWEEELWSVLMGTKSVQGMSTLGEPSPA